MGPFNFRLQSVLNLNTRMKRDAASRFAEARRTLKAHKHELKSHREELNKLGQSRSEPFRVLRADHFQTIRTRMSKYQNDIAATLKRIEDQLKVVQKKREELHLARQAKKKLDMLKSRQYTVWQRDNNRAEQRRLDETAGRMRYQIQREKST